MPIPIDSQLLLPVEGDPFTTERWFSQTHPMDAALIDELSVVISRELDVVAVVETPSAEFGALITEADVILQSVLPCLWPTLKPFVTRVYDMRSERSNSATFDNIGGAVLLSSAMLVHNERRQEQIVALAECLLHEAAHSKSYRLFRSFSRMVVPQSPDFIDIPWWRTANSGWAWDIDRSIVACHVYAHLSVFYQRLAPAEPIVRRRGAACAFRAAYLANVLLQLDDVWLDPDWRAFIEWVRCAIPAIPNLTATGREALSREITDFEAYPALMEAQKRLASLR